MVMEKLRPIIHFPQTIITESAIVRTGVNATSAVLRLWRVDVTMKSFSPTDFSRCMAWLSQYTPIDAVAIHEALCTLMRGIGYSEMHVSRLASPIHFKTSASA